MFLLFLLLTNSAFGERPGQLVPAETSHSGYAGNPGEELIVQYQRTLEIQPEENGLQLIAELSDGSQLYAEQEYPSNGLGYEGRNSQKFPTDNLVNSMLSDYFFQTPQQRFFLPNFKLFPAATVTSLITDTSTYTSTKTTTRVCLQAASPFCAARRRRRGVLEENEPVFLDGQPIHPTEVLKLVATEAPELSSRLSDSSEEVLAPSFDQEVPRRQPKLFFSYKSTVIIRTTVVSLSVTTVDSGRSQIVGIQADCVPACLSVLPRC